MTQQLHFMRIIEAPVEQVWEVLTDLPNAARRLSGLTSVDIMTSGPYAVGTRWRETRTFFGMTATEEMWVRRCDPLRSTVVEASNGGVDYVSTWRLRPVGPAEAESAGGDEAGRTQLSLEFTAVGPDTRLRNAAAAVLGPLGSRAFVKAIQQDLADMAVAASALATR
ncbi:MAG: SRPBCC family protein [Ornithinimicrobium sp.]